MGKKDPRVDAYIDKAADFAKPILNHIRRAVHSACPDVVETIKWGFPHFEYRGVLCSMAAFKQHCAFGFWHKAMRDHLGELDESNEAMGSLGRITKVSDLPKSAAFTKLIKQAMKLNENGVKVPVKKKMRAAKTAELPDDLMKALRKNKQAFATFEKLSPSHKREYVEWIVEAKRDETRERRMKTALEWLAKGKSRNWKYERK